MQNVTPPMAEVALTPKLSLLDYLHRHRPDELLWVDDLTRRLPSWEKWLADTEHNHGGSPTFGPDGSRVFDIYLLAWSQERSDGDQGCPSDGFDHAGGRPYGPKDLMEQINWAEVGMEEQETLGLLPAPIMEARRAAIKDADARLLEMGVDRAEVLAGWEQSRACTQAAIKRGVHPDVANRARQQNNEFFFAKSFATKRDRAD